MFILFTFPIDFLNKNNGNSSLGGAFVTIKLKAFATFYHGRKARARHTYLCPERNGNKFVAV